MTANYSQMSRMVAGIIAVIAGATLVLRLVLRASETGSAAEALLYLSNFFTILTNGLVFAMAIAVAAGVRVSPRFTLALTIAIAGVGIVYHVALAHLRELSGWTLLADHGVHTFVPGLTVIWWVLFAPKRSFKITDLAVWTVWPLTYCVYILIRASGSGLYPYPFLDLPTLGAGRLAINLVVLSGAFIVIGLLLVAVSKILKTPRSM